MTLRALLFDLDGTLVDSDPRHIEAFQRISERHGVRFDTDFFVREMSGHSNPEICAKLFPTLSPEEHRRIAEEKEDLFRSLIRGGVPAIPGVVDLIARAGRDGLALGVVSNAPAANVAASLAALGLEGRFSVEISGGMVARGKPDPMPYREALVRLGIPAGDAVAFEDTPLGIRAAVGAGLPTVGIGTTQPPERLAAAGASLVVRDFEDPALAPFLAMRA
ncbi:MAG: HAD family phosphatase [Telmatospirillum sp.]|nr:HAD family phosphatase [Telmatospirillum sp.]